MVLEEFLHAHCITASNDDKLRLYLNNALSSLKNNNLMGDFYTADYRELISRFSPKLISND